MTKRYFVEIGGCQLDLTVDYGRFGEKDVDLDGTFTAICNDTGEHLTVNGWLADDIIDISNEEELAA